MDSALRFLRDHHQRVLGVGWGIRSIKPKSGEGGSASSHGILRAQWNALPLFDSVRAWKTWKRNAIKFFQNLFSSSRALSRVPFGRACRRPVQAGAPCRGLCSTDLKGSWLLLLLLNEVSAGLFSKDVSHPALDPAGVPAWAAEKSAEFA